MIIGYLESLSNETLIICAIIIFILFVVITERLVNKQVGE